MCHLRICFWIFEQCILTTVGGRYVLHHQETHESTRKISVYRFTRHHGCYFTQCILWASKIFQIMWNGFDSLVIGVLFGWNSLKFICSVFLQISSRWNHPTTSNHPKDGRFKHIPHNLSSPCPSSRPYWPYAVSPSLNWVVATSLSRQRV